MNASIKIIRFRYPNKINLPCVPFQIPFSVLSFCSHSIRTSFYLVNSVISQMFNLNKTRKCEGMRRNSTPFFFEWRNDTPLISLLLLSRTVHSEKVVSFYNNQVNNECSPFLNGKECSSSFLYSHQGQHFQPPFFFFFSLPLTFILFIWRIPSFLFNSFPSFPFLSLFQI